jgi:hypothetical protein
VLPRLAFLLVLRLTMFCRIGLPLGLLAFEPGPRVQSCDKSFSGQRVESQVHASFLGSHSIQQNFSDSAACLSCERAIHKGAIGLRFCYSFRTCKAFW